MQQIHLPEKYTESMKELLGEEYPSYLESFSQPRIYGLRVNTSKISVEEFLRICPFQVTKVPWIPNGFYYEEKEKPAKHPYYFAGLYYLQEPSAMTPACVLPVGPGERVLDLCAAPGGKSTELGAKLDHTGLLVSNDISASRAKALLKNIEVFGIDRVLVTCEYPEKLAAEFGVFFDRILVDAPCSGEGMFRKDSKLIKSWESEGPAYYAPLQANILKNAAKMLKPGGSILYSTCTFSKMENEENIEKFLAEHPDFYPEHIFDYEGFVRAFGIKEAVRLFPHHLQGEGHFVALLRKEGTLEQDIGMSPARQPKLPAELESFLEACKTDLTDRTFVFQGERVLLVPTAAADRKGLRTLRSGLLFGELKKNRFEPSQALAMTLKDGDYSTTLNLSADDPRTVKYLKGETIEAQEHEITGNAKDVLIMVDHYPLGWGRNTGGTIKNKYLPGWRWM